MRNDQVIELIDLLNEYGDAKFGDEWWPGNADPFIGKTKAARLNDLLSAPNRDDTYNGWTNRETWALSLWLDNDPALHAEVLARVNDWRERYPDDFSKSDNLAHWRAGQAIEELYAEITDPDEITPTNVRMALDVGSSYRIDWAELGAAYLPLLDEG